MEFVLAKRVWARKLEKGHECSERRESVGIQKPSYNVVSSPKIVNVGNPQSEWDLHGLGVGVL